ISAGFDKSLAERQILIDSPKDYIDVTVTGVHNVANDLALFGNTTQIGTDYRARELGDLANETTNLSALSPEQISAGFDKSLAERQILIDSPKDYIDVTVTGV